MTAINAALISTVSTQTLQGFDVAEVSLLLANTEYTYTLPAGTKSFQLQARGNAVIKMRKTAAGPYWTFYPGQPYFPSNIVSSSTITLILESNQASTIVEIVSWS
jgi:hypothetical protein